MSNNNKHNVSDKELDNLLNQAFLNLDFTNPKNQELMETISKEVMQPKPVSYMDFINKSLFTKILVTVLFTISAITIYLAFFKTSTDKFNHKQFAKREILTTPNLKSTGQKQTKNPVITSKEENNKKSDTTIVTEEKPEEKITPPVTEPVTKQKPYYPFVEEEKSKAIDTSFVFPKLTEKEIKEHKSHKLWMIITMEKPSKDWYSLIGDQKAYGNMSDTTAAFYISSYEVSNLQYRTFLWDLIIQGRKEEFLKAKPHQELWLNAPGTPNRKKMKDNYFVDKKYDYYPVVNITPEAAELYCEWLSSIFNGDEELHARLPYESEWIRAAKPTKRNGAYTWGTDSIQNKVGCYMANICIQKSSEQLKTKMNCTQKNKNAYTSADLIVGDSMMTCKVYSYNQNYSGVFCMSGNVAEMVYKNTSKQVTTKGGSWNSDLEHCKNYSEEELTGDIKANPMTGFRPLLRYTFKKTFGSKELEDPKTGLSTLTALEIKNYTKRKRTMIYDLSKPYDNKYAHIPMGSCEYKNNAVSVQSFFMQNTEVSNVEYRTFLADLLMQGRNDDYLIAKPDQKQWTIKFPYSYNEPMEINYFWHPAYDEYPVVNISRKAAEMYCAWLTVETNKFLAEKHMPLINDLRIPTDVEWAYAASNGKNHVRYANGSESLKDSKEKYTANYSCYYLNECRYDSIKKLQLPQEGKKPKDKESQERTYISDGHFHTAPVRSYTANSYGLYCMGGNVAEMTTTFDLKTKTISGKGTKGGSWFSVDEFLQISADEEYPNELGASPLIGFRPVMTSLKK